MVWGVEDGDVLNVREGPGVDFPVVATLEPEAVGIQMCDASERVDEVLWWSLLIDGRIGWVNERHVKPEGADPPEVVGAADPRIVAAAAALREALLETDYARVAEFCDPARGVVVALYTYVTEHDPVLNCDQLRRAATDNTIVLWGDAAGSGFEIKRTIADRMDGISRSWALTSTEVIGFDEDIAGGNKINNLGEAFPGTNVVEYHFSETSRGFDWNSIRLVFETSGDGPPVLLAIVEVFWTI